MKRTTIGIAAVIAIVGAAALVGAVAIARAMLVPAPVEASAPPPPPIDPNLAAAHLAQALRFQTVSYGNGVKEKERSAALQEMHTWMERTYRYLHEAAPQEQFGESLLFVWRGTDENLPPVLLMAHLDVAPVAPGTEKDWTHAPFSGDIVDGFVWGRGAFDDKSSAIAILEAGERLSASGFQPRRTIMFALGEDAEAGGKGNAAIARALQSRGVHFAWVLDEGTAILNQPYPGVTTPVAFVSVAEKGFVSLELVAKGESGQGARPARDTAAPRLDDALKAVLNRPFVSDLDDIQRAKIEVLAPLAPFNERIKLANLWLLKPMVIGAMESNAETAGILSTTIMPANARTERKENAAPLAARAVIDVHTHQRDNIDSVIAHVKQAINNPNVDVKVLSETQSQASKVVDLGSRAYIYISREIAANFAVPVAPDLMPAATDSRHYLPVADAVLRFRPFPADASDLPRVHGTNERVAVSDLGPAVGFYMRLIQEPQ